MSDEIKKAEARGYSKGYRAGKKRIKHVISYEQKKKRIDAFWQRAFIAALPSCIAVDGWTSGNKPITSLSERTQLAINFADEALSKSLKRIS